MDNHRFDALARTLAAPSSRRGTLTALAAAALGGALIPFRAPAAAAACGKVGDDCRHRDNCCPDARCRGGICRCRPRFRNCDGRCRDLKSDPDHCGRCDRRCRRNHACIKGECVSGVGGGPGGGTCAGEFEFCESIDCCGGLECVFFRANGRSLCIRD